jgi:outer membrane protein OmpA-like peptidoglycan-associated protein
MPAQPIRRYLHGLGMLTVAGLITVGCLAKQPDTQADFETARNAILETKTYCRELCQGERKKPSQQKNQNLSSVVAKEPKAAPKGCLNYCKEKLKLVWESQKRPLLWEAREEIAAGGQKCPYLHRQYLEARAFFYACQDDVVTEMAADIICEAITLEYCETAPKAQFTISGERRIHELLTFDATASMDPDGDPLEYIWDFGDGKTAAKTSPIARHQYAEAGTHAVRLTVHDSKCGQDTLKKHITLARFEIFFNDVLFDFDKSELKPEAVTVLAGILRQMRENTRYRAKLVGFTDSKGPREYNQRLSEKRALAVKKFLMAGGIAEDRITSGGKGATNPIASNATEAGRAKNRRTEITLTLKPELRVKPSLP